MSQPLYTIQRLIKELPGKDSEICEKYLKDRNFESIREIVESDLYKARKSTDIEDSDTNKYIDSLMELECALDEYISYTEVSDDLYEDYE